MYRFENMDENPKNRSKSKKWIKIQKMDQNPKINQNYKMVQNQKMDQNPKNGYDLYLILRFYQKCWSGV